MLGYFYMDSLWPIFFYILDMEEVLLKLVCTLSVLMTFGYYDGNSHFLYFLGQDIVFQDM